jgi:hypothetical protein
MFTMTMALVPHTERSKSILHAEHQAAIVHSGNDGEEILGDSLEQMHGKGYFCFTP